MSRVSSGTFAWANHVRGWPGTDLLEGDEAFRDTGYLETAQSFWCVAIPDSFSCFETDYPFTRIAAHCLNHTAVTTDDRLALQFEIQHSHAVCSRAMSSSNMVPETVNPQ